MLVDQVCEWSQVSRRGIVKNFVAQYCNLILYALRDPQPVKADECVCVLSRWYSIVYHYNGAQQCEQLLQVGRLDQALILLDLALSSKHLCIFCLVLTSNRQTSSWSTTPCVIMVLCVFSKTFCYILYFTVLVS